MTTFQAVQSALYFPLGFSTLLGSILMLFLFEAPPGLNWIIRVVFAWNALRITARLLTGYAGIPLPARRRRLLRPHRLLAVQDS